jgi:hypothetical protein
MPHWLFPDFLSSADAYATAQRHWDRLWDKVLDRAGPAQQWQQPWMSNPFPDGNPIFTAVSLPLSRGVRIIQEPPGDPDDVDLDWWLDTFGDDHDPAGIRELVIACCPSNENAAAIEQLLFQWVQAGELKACG